MEKDKKLSRKVVAQGGSTPLAILNDTTDIIEQNESIVVAVKEIKESIPEAYDDSKVLEKLTEVERLLPKDFNPEPIVTAISNLAEEIKKKDFRGLKGDTPVKGKDYFDGYTPRKGVDYFDGEDGYTPIKNIDYFDGEDGSPDTPSQVFEKLMQYPELIPIAKIEGLKDLEHNIKHLYTGISETRALELIRSNSSSGGITSLTNDVVASGSGVVSARVVSASEGFAFSGVISPPSFGTRQDNYNPTGLSTASTIRLNATLGFVNITGIAGGYAGRVLILQNISNFNIQLAGESPFSSAANQFEKVYNSSEGIHIPPYSQTTIYYDGVSSKWRTQYPGILDITTTMGSLSRTGGRYFVDLDLEMGHENNWSARQNFLEFYAMGSLFTVDIDNKRYVLNENETSYFEIDSGSGLFDLNASQSDLRLGDIVNDTQKLIISPSSVNNRTQLGNITAGHQLDIDTANNNTKLGNTSSGTYLEIDHNSGLYYLRGLPTSDPGVTGALWLNGKVIEASP